MKTNTANIYENLNLHKIDSYGSHISTIKGGLGRISSFLHWNLGFDQRNLAQYYVEWAQANPNGKLEQNFPINQGLFEALNTIRALDNFDKFNSRELAHLILAFKDEAYKDHIVSLVSGYAKCKQTISTDQELQKHPSLKLDVNVYIHTILTQTNFIQNLDAITNKLINDVKDIATQSTIRTNWDSIKNAMKEGFIFEPMCSISFYLYTLFPLLDVTLNVLSNSMLFTYFWPFLFASIIATLSVTIIDGLLSGGLQGLQTQWNKQVSDDNSFHPIVEAIIGGLYITCSWLFIDKKSAQIGSLFYNLAQYGINNYVLKYFGMNLFFTLKTQLHQASIDKSTLIQSALAGAIRGVLKNTMINTMSHIIMDIQLHTASSLRSYTTFLAETYLKEWWINQVIAKTAIVSTPLWLLKNSPEKLISALWLTAEIAENCITNLSKLFEIIAIAILWPLMQKAYDYRNSISLAIAAIFLYHNPQYLTSFYSF